MFLGKTPQAGLPVEEGAIVMPALEPPMRRALRGSLGPAWKIAPAAAGDQDVEQAVHDRANRGRRHGTPTHWWCRGEDVLKELPPQASQSLESACHNALPHRFRA
jgi:hypothetical protein